MFNICALTWSTIHRVRNCCSTREYYLQGGPLHISDGSHPRRLISRANDVGDLELHRGGQLRVLIVLVEVSSMPVAK